MHENKSLYLIFLFSLGLGLISFNLNARSPAVEDFVGVETESYNELSPGEEFAFQFGNTVKALETPEKSSSAFALSSQLLPFAALAAFMLLPFFMWLAITRSTSMRTGASLDNRTSDNDNQYDNVTNFSEVLEDQRAKRNGEDSKRKAS